MNRIITALFLTFFLSTAASASNLKGNDYGQLSYQEFINLQDKLHKHYLDLYKQHFQKIINTQDELDKNNEAKREYKKLIDLTDTLDFDLGIRASRLEREAEKKKEELKKEKSDD